VPAACIVEGFIDFDYEITLLTVRANGANGDSDTSVLRADRPQAEVHGDYRRNLAAAADVARARWRARAEIAQARSLTQPGRTAACSASSCS
jgi:phosphoribosylglycinamide formyltransferase 2